MVSFSGECLVFWVLASLGGRGCEKDVLWFWLLGLLFGGEEGGRYKWRFEGRIFVLVLDKK